jgi:hypothetical protein
MAFTVCHAISIAITVVLPAPVASLSATRNSSGFASALALPRCLIMRLPDWSFVSPATSVSQIAVSTASTWQKNGRIPLKSWYSRTAAT